MHHAVLVMNEDARGLIAKLVEIRASRGKGRVQYTVLIGHHKDLRRCVCVCLECHPSLDCLRELADGIQAAAILERLFLPRRLDVAITEYDRRPVAHGVKLVAHVGRRGLNGGTAREAIKASKMCELRGHDRRKALSCRTLRVPGQAGVHRCMRHQLGQRARDAAGAAALALHDHTSQW